MTGSINIIPSFQLKKCFELNLNCEDYLSLRVQHVESGAIHIENGQVDKIKEESQREKLALESNSQTVQAVAPHEEVFYDPAISTSLYNNYPMDQQVNVSDESNIENNTAKLVEKPGIRKNLKLVYDRSKILEGEINDDSAKSIVRLKYL